MSIVKEFHEAFGHPIADKPRVPDFEARLLRVKLLLEEVLEFAHASGVEIVIRRRFDRGSPYGYPITYDDFNFSQRVAQGFGCFDMIEAADALGDIRYVTDGANLVWGFPQEEIINEIHRSNMSKLGEDGKPIYREDGKVLKGPNYSPPNILNILFKDAKVPKYENRPLLNIFDVVFQKEKPKDI